MAKPFKVKSSIQNPLSFVMLLLSCTSAKASHFELIFSASSLLHSPSHTHTLSLSSHPSVCVCVCEREYESQKHNSKYPRKSSGHLWIPHSVVHHGNSLFPAYPVEVQSRHYIIFVKLYLVMH